MRPLQEVLLQSRVNLEGYRFASSLDLWPDLATSTASVDCISQLRVTTSILSLDTCRLGASRAGKAQLCLHLTWMRQKRCVALTCLQATCESIRRDRTNHATRNLAVWCRFWCWQRPNHSLGGPDRGHASKSECRQMQSAKLKEDLGGIVFARFPTTCAYIWVPKMNVRFGTATLA